MKLFYVIREGFAGLFRTKFASFTSLFSLFLSVLLLSVLSRIGYSAFEFVQMLRQDISVEVFLENISGQRTSEFREFLEYQGWVSEVEYISRDKAAERFRNEFGEGAENLVELNFLPASFIVYVSDSVDVATIKTQVEEISEFDIVDEVVFNAALLEILEKRTQTLATIGVAVGIFILLVSLLLLYNTIRLTIYAKRDLIRAMKLIGATNSFIRGPFVVEGFIQGLLAAGLAVAVHVVIFQWVVPEKLPQLGVIAWPFSRWYYLVGSVFALSLFIGWWGSYWASTRFIGKTTLTRDSLLPKSSR